jgi:hypothetical protein
MRFSKRKGLLFLPLFFVVVFATFFALAVQRNGVGEDSITLLFGMVFSLFLAWFSVFAVADITIDGDGFHRTLFEWRLFSIRWSDVGLVTDRMERGQGGGPEARFITLVPKSEFSIGVFAKQSMRMGEGIIRFPEFIGAVNAELKKHNIPIELSRNGKTVMQEDLLLRIPEGQLWNPLRD